MSVAPHNANSFDVGDKTTALTANHVLHEPVIVEGVLNTDLITLRPQDFEFLLDTRNRILVVIMDVKSAAVMVRDHSLTTLRC